MVGGGHLEVVAETVVLFAFEATRSKLLASLLVETKHLLVRLISHLHLDEQKHLQTTDGGGEFVGTCCR